MLHSMSSERLFAGRSDIFCIEEYDPNVSTELIAPEMSLSKKYLDRLLRLISKGQASDYSLIKTVQQVISRWDSLLAQRYAGEVKQLEDILCNAPEILLSDENKKNAYLHLCAKCLAGRMDLSINSFHTVLTDMKAKEYQVHAPIANFIESLAKKMALIAIQCFPLLSKETQSKMLNILNLLQQQPNNTFEHRESHRFKVFSVAADCFSLLDANMSLPSLELPARKAAFTCEFDDWEYLKSSAKDFMPEGALYDSSTLVSLPSTRCLPSHALSSAALYQGTILSTEITPPAESFSSEEDSFEINSRKESGFSNFRLIHKFGSSFLIQYGDFILSEAATGLIETTKNSKQKKRLLDLAFAYFDSMENFNDDFYKGIKTLLRSALAKHLPNLINEIATQTKLALKSPDFGPRFCELAIKKWTPICFSRPLPSPRENKHFFINKLQSFANFLTDLNASLLAIAQSSPSQLPVALEEQLLIIEMNRKMAARRLPILIPAHKNLCVIEENIFKATEEMLRSCMGLSQEFFKSNSTGTKEQELLLFVLASVLSQMLNSIFSSNGLCIFIDLLSQHTYSAMAKGNKKAPLEEAFTDALTIRLEKIAVELFTLSSPSSTALQLFSAAVNPPLGSPIKKAAKLINRIFEEYVCAKELSEVLITPILLLNHLLFSNNSNKNDTTKETASKRLLDYLKMDNETFAEMKQKIDEQLQAKSMELFSTFVDTRLSWLTKFMVKPVADAFCKSLIDRLHRLSKQEMIIKMLMSYMIFGSQKAL